MHESDYKSLTEGNSNTNGNNALNIHADEDLASDTNFDNISLSSGLSQFLKADNNDWRLSEINASQINPNLSDLPVTPLLHHTDLTQNSLQTIGNPISDQNMIVEEPSPENEVKKNYQGNIKYDKNYNMNLSNNQNNLREAVLKKMKKTNDIALKKPRPAFINKVWLMVNDENTDDCICWADDGDSFVITHQIDFVTKVLPKYFKHCKIASFIRQLNMYGWKKMQDAKSGGLNDPNEERLQFHNENFCKGRPDLLDLISRQKPQAHISNNSTKIINENILHENLNLNAGIESKRSLGDVPMRNNMNTQGLSWKMPQYIPLNNNNMNPMNLIEAPMSTADNKHSKINEVAVIQPSNNISTTHRNGLDTSVLLQEFETLKYNQISMAEDLKRLANQNDVLWKHNVDTRKRLQKQENALQQILKFMSNYFGPGVQRLIQQDLGTNIDTSIEIAGNNSGSTADTSNGKIKRSDKIVNLDETPNKQKSRTNSTSVQINTGNGKTAQIQEILDDDLMDSPNDNNNMNAPIIDELSPLNSTIGYSNKKIVNSPMIQSVDSNKSPESVQEIPVKSNSNIKNFVETPRFDLPSEHTPLSESNLYRSFRNKNNIPISREAFPGITSDERNDSFNLLDETNNYTDILSNLQENIKKQEEHLSGFSQILNKLHGNGDGDASSSHNQQPSNDSPLINPFDLNDYLSTTPNTPSMFNSSRQFPSVSEKPIVEEIADSDTLSSNKRKVSMADIPVDEEYSGIKKSKNDYK
ncbi:hypothetical protein QEN19_000362 [Hanseniaspora menglaensis]